MSTATGHHTTTGYAVQAVDAVKRYGRADATVTALDAVTIGFERGRFAAIMGPSGSGKSTLLHCLAGLDTLTSGQVLLGGTDLATLDDTRLTRLRRDRLGFVFQTFNLVPALTVAENIRLPLGLAGRSVDRDWYHAVVDMVGLGNRLEHRPAELSGGQRQRVAIARALVGRPDIVFADEPTGNLDRRSGGEVLRFLRQAADTLGQTVVMVTHDPVAAGVTDRVVFLADGRIATELAAPSTAGVLQVMGRLAA